MSEGMGETSIAFAIVAHGHSDGEDSVGKNGGEGAVGKDVVSEDAVDEDNGNDLEGLSDVQQSVESGSVISENVSTVEIEVEVSTFFFLKDDERKNESIVGLSAFPFLSVPFSENENAS
jgi:hypothetical protein